jgi:hypothetical protein
MDMRIPKTSLQLLIVCERAGRAIPLARISDSRWSRPQPGVQLRRLPPARTR